MKILTLPDKRLLRVAKEVPEDEDCWTLIEQMFTILGSTGFGLAAPQLGIDKRIIVINFNSTRHAIINPVLTPNTKIRPKLFDEGCLSVHGERVMVRRWRKVKVKGFDQNWKPITVGGKNYMAAVYQHEVDHLNGKVIGQ